MKVTVDFDITPEEVRKLFGLPDVEAFQRQMMDEIRDRMLAGADGYDPIKLFQPYMTGTMAGWDFFQKMFANMSTLSGSGSSRSESSDKDTDGEGNLPTRKR